jgi:hypothetical protein
MSLGGNASHLYLGSFYLLLVYLAKRSLCISPNDRMINELWIGNDVDGCCCGLYQGNITAFAWKEWEKYQSGHLIVQADIQTRHLQNTARRSEPIGSLTFRRNYDGLGDVTVLWEVTVTRTGNPAISWRLFSCARRRVNTCVCLFSQSTLPFNPFKAQQLLQASSFST